MSIVIVRLGKAFSGVNPLEMIETQGTQGSTFRGKVLHVLEEMQSGGTDIIWYQSIHLENHPFLYLTVKV